MSLHDIPQEGKKEASDKALIVDMFLFAVDFRSPAVIFLITGDKDFSNASHKLYQRKYEVNLPFFFCLLY